MSAQKVALRRELRAKRRALTLLDRKRSSALAAKAILRLPQLRAGRRVAMYLAFDGETDTAALIAAARRRGVNVFVPVVGDRRHRRLHFCPWSGKTRRGAFGIAIPQRSIRRVAPRWFDLIVVPLVGIDTAGRRLGMGGGFYDRAMAFRAPRRCWYGPRLVGLAFDCQRVQSVHAERWDLRLDSLATESGLHDYRKGDP